jgi:iron complex outermembrane recepter protein
MKVASGISIGPAALAAALSGFICLPSALAQTAVEPAPAETTEVLEEIIVTAQRREQALKDVPVSISAFSSAKIEDYKIENLEDYTSLAPSVGFTSNGSPLSQAISIRGISDLGGTVSPISLFVDNFNTTASGFDAALDIGLFDVERIEVLRGPQGTLFGRNVSGGAISVITKKPGREFGANVSLEAGSFDHYKVEGALNLPITDNVAFRVSGFADGDDGFLKNLGASGQSNELRSEGVRAALRIWASDQTVIDLAGTYSKTTADLADLVPTGLLSPFLSANGFPVDPADSYGEVGFFPSNDGTVVTDALTGESREIKLFNGQIDHDFGNVVGTINVGHMDIDTEFFSDADYTGGPYNIFDEASSGYTWSVETQIKSDYDAGGNWSWLGGAVVAKDRVENRDANFLFDGYLVDFFGFPPGSGPLAVEDIEFLTEVKSVAAFGDVTWTGIDRLTLSTGLRYSEDEVREEFASNEIVFPFFGPPGIIIPATAPISGQEKSRTITPRLSATYVLSDQINGYGVISKGARPGGTNLEAATNPALPQNYGIEKVLNYELGIKGGIFQNALTFSIAAFYLDWSGLQAASRVFVPGDIIGTNLTLSAGKARTYGTELEFSANLSERFKIDGAFGVLDAKFQDFQTVDELGDPYDASGNKIPLVSEFMGALAGQYTHPLSDSASIFVRGETAYRSGFWESSLNADGTQPKIDGYETVNIRIGADIGQYRVTVFGENISNDRVNIGSTGGTGGLAGLLATVRPTIWGVNVAVEF